MAKRRHFEPFLDKDGIKVAWRFYAFAFAALAATGGLCMIYEVNDLPPAMHKLLHTFISLLQRAGPSVLPLGRKLLSSSYFAAMEKLNKNFLLVAYLNASLRPYHASFLPLRNCILVQIKHQPLGSYEFLAWVSTSTGQI